MPRASNVVGQIRIRQVYSRMGHNYCAISMPRAIMDYLGWGPGESLTYFATQDKGMKLMRSSDAYASIAEFDPKSIAAPKAIRGPRPGSLAEKEVQGEQKLDELIDRMTKATRRDQAPKKKPKPSRRRR